MTTHSNTRTVDSWHVDDPLISTASHAICLTGMGRSGTTLLGTIIHSMKNVEYGFEPPMLGSLFDRMELIPEEIWKRLYMEYLFEELLLESLSGRRLNFQDSDWSYIFHAKPIGEIKARFGDSKRKRDIYETAAQTTISYKVPNITHRLDALVEMFPKTRVAITLRDPDEVACSVMQRGWFRGENISYKLCGHLRKSGTRYVTSCLVGISDSDWLELDEEERCHACYVGCYEAVADSNYLMLDYAKLLRYPKEMIACLSEAFGLKWGELTEHLVRGIVPPHHAGPKTSGEGPWGKRARDLYATCRSKSL